jgi:hypothetical protein
MAIIKLSPGTIASGKSGTGHKTLIIRFAASGSAVCCHFVMLRESGKPLHADQKESRPHVSGCLLGVESEHSPAHLNRQTLEKAYVP